MEPSDQKPDIDTLLAEIRAKVDARRREGFYPPGLEDDLSAHFERIVNFRARDLSDLQARVETLRASLDFSQAKISTESRRPGGRFMHRVIAKLVNRQIEGVFDQMREFAQRTQETLDEVLSTLEEPNRQAAYMIGYADSLLERLTQRGRDLDEMRAEVEAVKKRLSELESSSSD